MPTTLAIGTYLFQNIASLFLQSTLERTKLKAGPQWHGSLSWVFTVRPREDYANASPQWHGSLPWTFSFWVSSGLEAEVGCLPYQLIDIFGTAEKQDIWRHLARATCLFWFLTRADARCLPFNTISRPCAGNQHLALLALYFVPFTHKKNVVRRSYRPQGLSKHLWCPWEL